MKSLYLRVWLTIVALLALFALAASLLFRHEVVRERGRFDALAAERAEAWAELIEHTLPGADAPREQQANAVRDWSQRLGLPLAMDDARGTRIVESDSFRRRVGAHDRPPPRVTRVKLDDGRSLSVIGARLGLERPMRPGRGLEYGRPDEDAGPPGAGSARRRDGGTPAQADSGPGGPMVDVPRGWPWPQGIGLVTVLALLFIGVAAGAYPVVRRLTRRLEALGRGVEGFGAGDLASRVDASGKDEVAAVARAFNQAAQRIESLVKSNQSLLANASHELRSPLARLKMAVSMLEPHMPPERREALEREIHTNIGELDALVDEVLLASRLDAQQQLDRDDGVDLGALAIEEAARAQVDAPKDGTSKPLLVIGDERLLRRAVRNLLENARRYGGGSVEVSLGEEAAPGPNVADQPSVVVRPSTVVLPPVVVLRVADRGPGVPQDMRERIFEPFFRLPGHAEREGGVGLGLALVRQIAHRHGGQVRVQARDGGGSVFVLTLPQAPNRSP
jgi:signal transduction histidine kinase